MRRMWLSILVVAGAMAQTPDTVKRLPFSEADSPRAVQEMINAIRGTAAIKELQIAVDFNTHTLTIQGPAAEAGLGE